MDISEQRICFIINPSSNSSRSARHIEWIREEAGNRWRTYEISIMQEHQKLSAIASEKAKHFDVVVACGGDGTVSQIINGLAECTVQLGVLPIGSGNDFVKSLKLNRPLPECMEIIHQGHTTEIDLIKIEGDKEAWCSNTLGIGLDGLANFYAHESRSGRGPLIYFWGALKAIFTFRGTHMRLYTDRVLKDEPLLMVTACNGRWEGGTFHVAPNADMTDGLMDLLVIEKISIPRLIPYLIQFKKGPSYKMRGVSFFRAEECNLISDKGLAVHCDGEHLGSDIRHLELSVQKKALRVIIPGDHY